MTDHQCLFVSSVVSTAEAYAQVCAVTGLRKQLDRAARLLKQFGDEGGNFIQPRRFARSRFAFDQRTGQFEDGGLTFSEMRE